MKSNVSRGLPQQLGAQAVDEVLERIAAYVLQSRIESPVAEETARFAMLDAVGCGIAALNHPECLKVLGPVVPGTTVPNGARVPGTDYVLDPVRATFNLGAMIRWLDFNDTWLAKEWSHPSDNLAGLLMIGDHLSQVRRIRGEAPVNIGEILHYLTKAYEIQGVLALGNSLNHHGLDHVWFVKVATAAVVTALLGGNHTQVRNAVSQSWVDNVSLRTYRHAPNAGWRKSWAAADAARRGAEFAWLSLRSDEGYPSILTAPKWGINDVIFGGTPVTLVRELGCYVMENVLFKVCYPAEFHAQTALEAAVRLHRDVAWRWQDVERIIIRTHESAIRIIDKKGPLRNPADRDHCLQYIVALGLLFGNVNSEMYEDETASDRRIDFLRERMDVIEEPQFSHDYLDENKRSVASSVQVFFTDGSSTPALLVEYPLGHPRRRQEAWLKLLAKFRANLAPRFSPARVDEIVERTWNNAQLSAMPVDEFVSLFLPEND